MLHTHIPTVVFNQRERIHDSLYAAPISGKTLVEPGTSGPRGALLDVFNPEPAADHPRLWDTRNLIIESQITADGGDAYVPMFPGLLLQSKQLFLAGKPFLNPVKREFYY